MAKLTLLSFEIVGFPNMLQFKSFCIKNQTNLQSAKLYDCNVDIQVMFDCKMDRVVYFKFKCDFNNAFFRKRLYQMSSLSQGVVEIRHLQIKIIKY